MLTVDSRPVTARDPLSGPSRSDHTGEGISAVRSLLRAAIRLDFDGADDTLARSVTESGVLVTWDRLIAPTLGTLGRLTQDDARVIAAQCLLSVSISRAFSAVPRPPASSAPGTLLACADEEQHTLGLEALTAALAECGEQSYLLGARMPLGALLRAVERVRPAVVIIWSQTPATADLACLTMISATSPHPTVIAAGPGWGADSNFSAALAGTLQVLRGQAPTELTVANCIHKRWYG